MTAIGRLLRASSRGLCLAAALAALVPGCERGPSPPSLSVRSIRKVEGPPAYMLDLRLAPDGASALVSEVRLPPAEAEDTSLTYAISRRPLGGGAVKDLLASKARIVKFVPFGDGVAVMQEGLLPKRQDEPPDGARRADQEHERQIKQFEEQLARMNSVALYRVGDGGAPVKISPEGQRCVNVAGTADGQWIAFTTAPPGGGAVDGDVHVLDAKTGATTTLGIKGAVSEIAPDGARILVRNRPYDTSSTGVTPPGAPDPWRPDDAKSTVMVTVKDRSVTTLPVSIRVDGADVDTSGLEVDFMGDGLAFISERGERYRSALDGTDAVRVADPLPQDEQPENAGPLPDGGAPAPARVRRFAGPLGTLYELRQEESGSVDLSALAPGKPGARVPIAKLEGPLAAFDEVTFDAAEKRVAIAVLTDMSCDGIVDAQHDGAEIYVTDTAEGSLSFGRAPDGARADELRGKIAAAVGLPVSSVSITPLNGWPEVTVELPRIEGEKAAALLDRALAAGRSGRGAFGGLRPMLRVRVGPVEMKVEQARNDSGHPYIVLLLGDQALSDPGALPLVQHNATKTRAFLSSTQTLSGYLENTGKEPTAPLEAVALLTGRYGSPEDREITKPLGVIAPGKRVSYQLIATDTYGKELLGPIFRAEGKPLTVLNRYAHEHMTDWLDTALAVYARDGAWSEHPAMKSSSEPFTVKLSAEQAALPYFERDKLLGRIGEGLKGHYQRFHGGELGTYSVRFAAPDGMIIERAAWGK